MIQKENSFSTALWLDIEPYLRSLSPSWFKCCKNKLGLCFSKLSLVLVMKKSNICISSPLSVAGGPESNVNWDFSAPEWKCGRWVALVLCCCALQQDFNLNCSAGILSQTWVTGCKCRTQARTKCVKLGGNKIPLQAQKAQVGQVKYRILRSPHTWTNQTDQQWDSRGINPLCIAWLEISLQIKLIRHYLQSFLVQQYVQKNDNLFEVLAPYRCFCTAVVDVLQRSLKTMSSVHLQNMDSPF